MVKSSLFLFCFLSACFGSKNSKKQAPEPIQILVENHNVANNLERQWMLVQFKDYKKEYLAEKKASITISKDQSVSIYMGCNKGGGKIELKGDNKFQFLNTFSTEMACEDMKLESDMFMTLSSVETYKLEGHFLYLFTKSGETVKFIAADWD